MRRQLLLLCLVGLPVSTAAAQSVTAGPASREAATHERAAQELDATPTAAFVVGLEALVNAGDTAGLRGLFGPLVSENDIAAAVDDLAIPNAVRTTFRERDRAALAGVEPGSGVRIVVESFSETADAGRITTLRLDLRRFDNLPGTPWRIVAFDRLTLVDGLYKLALDTQTQYTVNNLRLTAEDLDIHVTTGSAFVAMTPAGMTALVVMGSGTMTFHPRPEAEQVQVKLFSGSPVLVAPFSVAWIRINPLDLRDRLGSQALVPRPVDQRVLVRAQAVFTEEVTRSFSLDLSDLSRDTWTLIPGYGDLLTTLRTRKFGSLTYTHSKNDAEDVSLFDRQRRRNISVYASRQRLASRGRGYDEDQLSDYDVISYTVDASYTPAREWIEGRATMTLRVRSYALSTLTVKLAESLVVRSVVADRGGRLLALRVREQNAVLVSLPLPASRGDTLTLTIAYGGRLESLSPEREVVALAAAQAQQGGLLFPDAPLLVPEERWVFTTRSDWYPQAPVTDYATATMRLTVPAIYQVMASGDSMGPPELTTSPAAGPEGLATYRFVAGQPVRYLAWVITRLTTSATASVSVPPADASTPPATSTPDSPPPAASAPAASTGELVIPGLSPQPVPVGAVYTTLDLSVVANPRQVSRGKALAEQARQIFEVYGTLVGDLPYPSFTLTLVDNELPGGHSPAYFALLHQPLPTTPYTWRNDPVYFDEFPQFFLAHELAHQFWGQAVGWSSYHDQWISEGFAQYFALLYAEHHGGARLVRTVTDKMRNSALQYTSQGPIWLGYRLGHVRNDSRVFRAIVYNKSALALHMLRGLIGDDRFFLGIRTLYRTGRFRKIGTDDVRRTFEQVSGQPLERFFERWMYEFGIPRLSWQAESTAGTWRIVLDQEGDRLFDFPVRVSYVDEAGRLVVATIPVTARQVVYTLPTAGQVRDLRVDHGGSLVRLERRR